MAASILCRLQEVWIISESEFTNNIEWSKKLYTVIESFARMEKELVVKESNIEEIIEEKVESGKVP